MGKMIKLDSFLKETMRMNTLSCRESQTLKPWLGILICFSKSPWLVKSLKILHSQMGHMYPVEHFSLLLVMAFIMMRSVFRTTQSGLLLKISRLSTQITTPSMDSAFLNWNNPPTGAPPNIIWWHPHRNSYFSDMGDVCVQGDSLLLTSWKRL